MNELKNKTIGVFFGGQSPEHEISIITGEFIIAKLKKMKFNVVAVYVDKKGRWYVDDKISKLKFFKGNYKEKLTKMPKYSLDLVNSQNKLVVINKKFFIKKEIIIDFVFPAFHGLCGEDGTIQGLCEFFKIPYAGCGIYASALAIDKVFTKQLLKSINIPTTNFMVFTKNEWNNNNKILDDVKNILKFPVFVKPSRAGSSIGISKVKSFDKLEEAFDLSFYYDTKIIVENGVNNVADLTCAVLSDGKKIITSEVQESLYESDLFDYNVKYLEDGGVQTGNAESNIVIPAMIESKIKSKIKEQSKEIFKAMNANGTARIDFLLDKKNNKLYANEINTLPGTLYHHLWEKSGLSITKVLEEMLMVGILRWKNEQNKYIDFNTDVLNSANQMKLRI